MELRPLSFGEGHTPFQLSYCPVNNCVLTTNTSLVPGARVDAVIMHLWTMIRDGTPLPERKKLDRAIHKYFEKGVQFTVSESFENFYRSCNREMLLFSCFATLKTQE